MPGSGTGLAGGEGTVGAGAENALQVIARTEVSRLVSAAAGEIESSGSDTPRLDAAILLRFVLGLSEIDYYSLNEIHATRGQLDEFEALVAKRSAGEPVAYLTRHKEFMSLDFAVDRRVLIPRADTEILVEQAIAFAEHKFAGRPNIRLADVGTGSGAIAVSLAHFLPSATVYAIDISPDALDVARGNAARHRVEKRITFIQGDLLEALPERVDVIAANLPYTIYDELPREVTVYEPRLALDGGAAGLDLYRRLFEQAPERLTVGGALFLEIDPRQADKISALAWGSFPGSGIQVVRDLAGRDRLVIVAHGG
jgi:release factor glutamine methyltransferase